jgi:2-keto-4-pentenoate hydratase/2-oxohepta-3-ene-1,7-dioic acid hydratase in catechol pathway
MRLVTYTHEGSTLPGAIAANGDIVDLAVAGLPTTMIELLAMPDGLELARKAAKLATTTVPIKIVRIEAPVPRPGKVLAIGLNYRDHAEESGQPIPQRPVVFAKASTCIVGPGDAIHIPRVSRAVDWEAELCFVIGKTARYAKAADAGQYVAGYTIGNDVSVRDWQFHSPTWMMGKSFDTHGPLGPYLVTPDEAGDVANLDIKLFVNGEQKQSSNTGQLIFGVGEIIEYLSAGMTLEPGDVVFTGTPAGVGGTRQPPEFLKAGDTVRVEISGLGVLENPVVAEPA